MVEYRHDMVPGDFEDPRRCESRPTFLHLKLCHFFCCTIEHRLGVHVWCIKLMILLNERRSNNIEHKCDTESLLKSDLSNLIQQPPIPMGEVNIIPKGRQQRNIFVAGETIGKRSGKEVLFVLTDRLKVDKSVIWKLMQSERKGWVWYQLDKLTININLSKIKVFI